MVTWYANILWHHVQHLNVVSLRPSECCEWSQRWNRPKSLRSLPISGLDIPDASEWNSWKPERCLSKVWLQRNPFSFRLRVHVHPFMATVAIWICYALHRNSWKTTGFVPFRVSIERLQHWANMFKPGIRRMDTNDGATWNESLKQDKALASLICALQVRCKNKFWIVISRTMLVSNTGLVDSMFVLAAFQMWWMLPMPLHLTLFQRPGQWTHSQTKQI